MLAIRKYIPQVGILAGYPVLELDLRKGVLVRRLKAVEVLADIEKFGQAKYLYLYLSSNNLKDKELKKLCTQLVASNMQLFISTDCQVADGLANILHLLSGIELNYIDCSMQDIHRVSLLAATRSLQLNISFKKSSLHQEVASFLPLFSELQSADINLYVQAAAEINVLLPPNVRVRIQ